MPEWENFDSTDISDDLAVKLKPIVAQFLQRGGKIVVLCPSDDFAAFLRDAGVTPYDFSEGEDPETVQFTADGKRWSAGIGAEFQATNRIASYCFGEGPEPTIIASYEDGAVAMISKIGRGRVIVFGADFYESSGDTDRLLANLILY
jgi:hypothetical protein